MKNDHLSRLTFKVWNWGLWSLCFSIICSLSSNFAGTIHIYDLSSESFCTVVLLQAVVVLVPLAFQICGYMQPRKFTPTGSLVYLTLGERNAHSTEVTVQSEREFSGYSDINPSRVFLFLLPTSVCFCVCLLSDSITISQTSSQALWSRSPGVCI